MGLSFSPPTPFTTVACYAFTSPSFSFSVASTPTLSMSKDGNHNNVNAHGNNNARNQPPLNSWVVVDHADTAFRDHDSNTTYHPWKEEPYQETGRLMLPSHWMNGLRSNMRPVEPSKLDIVSTSNNFWVRWATLIGISLVFSTALIQKDPSLHWQEVLQLHRERSPRQPIPNMKLLWRLYNIPCQARLC
jgi:hypothetical protein